MLGGLTANQSKNAMLLAFSALQCATCVPNLALIRPASVPVAPFPPTPSTEIDRSLRKEFTRRACHFLPAGTSHS